MRLFYVSMSGVFVFCLITNSMRGGEGKGTTITLDGLKSVAPAHWVSEKPKFGTRVVQMRIPKAAGDAYDAELSISHFGKGGGGGLQANLERWKGMVEPPPGKSIDEIYKKETFKVGDVDVVVVDLQGTYKAPPFEKIEPRPNYRTIRAYFDSKEGPYFIGLIGPVKTVTENKNAFDNWLKSFK